VLPSADETIYAAIARGLMLDGTGVPSVLRGYPAVDHLTFYGPVFVRSVAWLFGWLGVQAEAFRMVTLAGALLLAGAAAGLARTLGRSPCQQAWAATLVLLAPTVGSLAAGGRMDPLTVGLLMFGAMLHAHALGHPRASFGWGLSAGLAIAAAVLSAPRALLFAGVLLATASGTALVARDAAHSARRQACWLWGGFVLPLVLWSFTEGGPLALAQFHWRISSLEATELMLPDGATRYWSIGEAPWRLLSAAAGIIACALAFAWRRNVAAGPSRSAATFALVAGAANFALSCALLNLTFAFAMYFTIPLLAIGAAAIAPVTPRQRQLVAALLVALVSVDLAIRTAKYVRIAATWDARSSARVERFVADHVPPGSLVFGPYEMFFYAVEGTGSHYSAPSRVSWATWARLVPPTHVIPRPIAATAARFLIWPDRDARAPFPAHLACPGAMVVGRLEPPPTLSGRLGPLGRLRWTDGYPPTTLYALPAGCGDEGAGALR
jgi:hypothetical protein